MPATRKARFTGVYASGLVHWQYRISLPKDPATGKRSQEVRGGFQSDEDAHFARQRRMVELGLGDDIPDDRMTVGAWVNQYLDSHALNVDESSIHNYRGRVQYLTPLADVRLRELTVPRVQRWVDALARSKSPATARTARGLLVQALNEAIRQRLIATNVAHLSRAPRHTPAKRVILSGDDISRFAATAERDRLGAAWMLLLLCQLRPGEIAGLRWPDIDLDRGRVHVDITRTRNVKGQWVLGDGPKRESSRRTIDLPDICVRLLKEHRRAQNERRLQAPPGWWTDRDLVFPNARGDVITNHVLETRLKRVCLTAGVPVLTPHSLRTTGATWARSLGEDAEVVQRRLGHKNVQTTLNLYSYERPGESRQTSERLEDALRKQG